jgi:hypothetical protein
VFDAWRLFDAIVAATFVLITTDMVLSFLDECDIRRRHGSKDSAWTALSGVDAPKCHPARGTGC